MSVIDTTKLDL